MVEVNIWILFLSLVIVGAIGYFICVLQNPAWHARLYVLELWSEPNFQGAKYMRLIDEIGDNIQVMDTFGSVKLRAIARDTLITVRLSDSQGDFFTLSNSSGSVSVAAPHPRALQPGPKTVTISLFSTVATLPKKANQKRNVIARVM